MYVGKIHFTCQHKLLSIFASFVIIIVQLGDIGYVRSCTAFPIFYDFRFTMVMHVELQATCSSLGYIEGNKYIKEPDCLGMCTLYCEQHVCGLYASFLVLFLTHPLSDFIRNSFPVLMWPTL